MVHHILNMEKQREQTEYSHKEFRGTWEERPVEQDQKYEFKKMLDQQKELNGTRYSDIFY